MWTSAPSISDLPPQQKPTRQPCCRVGFFMNAKKKFLGAAFFQKDGVLSKLFEKSFTKNVLMISGCFPG
ncbi:hypothetical protein [Komagataeibacter xylinus]|uniref:hypothetical protein n=1 Tax=Komagataeibacter xylinus TaxID=28448 RepID=UPI00102FBB5E|nr:hypothetical protein [Komagataeibacter xylinus]